MTSQKTRFSKHINVFSAKDDSIKDSYPIQQQRRFHEVQVRVCKVYTGMFSSQLKEEREGESTALQDSDAQIYISV